LAHFTALLVLFKDVRRVSSDARPTDYIAELYLGWDHQREKLTLDYSSSPSLLELSSRAVAKLQLLDLRSYTILIL